LLVDFFTHFVRGFFTHFVRGFFTHFVRGGLGWRLVVGYISERDFAL
jgi:hypothetical protein